MKFIVVVFLCIEGKFIDKTPIDISNGIRAYILILEGKKNLSPEIDFEDF